MHMFKFSLYAKKHLALFHSGHFDELNDLNNLGSGSVTVPLVLKYFQIGAVVVDKKILNLFSFRCHDNQDFAWN